jgi:hypothetical protein
MSYQSSSGATGSVPNSNMAVVSLVFGILGLTFLPTLGSIVALITGYLARKEIGQSAGALGGEGLATAGIVLGRCRSGRDWAVRCWLFHRHTALPGPPGHLVITIHLALTRFLVAGFLAHTHTEKAFRTSWVM